MKNIIIVNVDTNRTPVIQIGKMEGSELPKNSDEARDVILKDMACLTEALCTLIDGADQSNLKSKEESLKDVMTHLERGLANEIDVKITQLDSNTQKTEEQ